MIARDKKGWTISDQIFGVFLRGWGWMGFCLRVERSSMHIHVLWDGFGWVVKYKSPKTLLTHHRDCCLYTCYGFWITPILKFIVCLYNCNTCIHEESVIHCKCVIHCI